MGLRALNVLGFLASQPALERVKLAAADSSGKGTLCYVAQMREAR